ncbi:MAG: hypothetical protein ABII22_00705 [Candidatus Micrarchaeota archaeon]
MKKPTPKEMTKAMILSKEDFDKKYWICGTAKRAMNELKKKRK